VGVVVNPVRIASLKDFGSLEFVADKLLAAETRKVGPALSPTALSCASGAYRNSMPSSSTPQPCYLSSNALIPA